jgi:hypothetical protein
MAKLNKIDSNVTGLRYAEEESFKTLPTTPVWKPLEPNSYADFGGQVATVARNPINPSRQRKKGVVTDLDANGGFDTDVTQGNLQDLMQGFMFADLRRKVEFGGDSEITGVVNASSDYTAASGLDAFAAGDLVFATGFNNAANNGLKTVTGAASGALTVSETLVDETPPAGAKLVQVGHQFAADDLNVDVSGSLPQITSDATYDFTALGLVPGEWIFIGGDGASNQFANAVNNGFARVLSATADGITLDKTQNTMVTEDLSGGETVQMFFGRVLKNESDPSLIKRRTYNMERTLGAPESTSPSQIQAEYISGAVPGEFTLNVPTADKVTASLAFTGADNETIDGPTSLKTGDRPGLVEADAFNTSSDFARIKMAKVVDGDPAPTALFAFLTEMTLSINNNLTPNKAVGVLGAFEVTAGTFEVSGDLTAYFADVAAIQAVRDNADITLDAHMIKANAGISIDVPLITLGDGRPNVSQDEPITLPLNMAAATGAKVNSSLDHTLLLVFWDYLPDAAE